MPTLPLELTDRIIDCLHHHGDPTTLSACALVASSWAATARYHRFARTSVTCHELVAYLALLDCSPEAGRRVRRLTVTSVQDCACHRAIEVETLLCASPNHDPALMPQIFARMPALTELHVVRMPLLMFIDSIPSTVTKLLLRDVRFPRVAHAVQAFRLPTISSLLIIHPFVADRDSASEVTTNIQPIPDPVSFTEFGLWAYDGVTTTACKWLATQGVGRRLRSLAVYLFDTDMLGAYAPLFRTLGPSLTHLEVMIQPWTNIDSDSEHTAPVDWALENCTNLKHIRVLNYISWTMIPMDKALVFLRNLRSPSVSSLTFVLDVSRFAEGSTRLGGIEWVNSALELLSEDTYKRVRRVAWELHHRDKPESMGGTTLSELAKAAAVAITKKWEGHHKPGVEFTITRVAEPSVPCAWDDGKIHPLGAETIVTYTHDDRHCRWHLT
ncbi:hypothetical protein L226DRAFT_55257 [Lentinus tigrinus ALCF2SS1-7]|uniref:uncharacterized protein n=1 Tax=Lentinus tigrinus ALCF2SS1-7 TaxID=1328758 RepID=UPI00116632E9|nr:hypothetical protein L226DRAFT_55257 [Lentinus tigrinus ALCF2SS1-7]